MPTMKRSATMASIVRTTKRPQIDPFEPIAAGDS